MEITLNGQLVTCTPDEYARLIQLGLIPTQSAGTKTSPIQITPQPSLPDDIVPLPKEDFPKQPKQRNPYEPDPDDFWKKNRTHGVALYGCIVEDYTQLGDNIKFDMGTTIGDPVKQSPDLTVRIDSTTKPISVDHPSYVIKQKDNNLWWSSQTTSLTTSNEDDAKLYTNLSEAETILSYINTHLAPRLTPSSEFEIYPKPSK